MTPATLPPVGYDPTAIAPANVPSFAEEHATRRAVNLSHPSDDPTHPSLVAAAKRYRGRGWSVAIVPFRRQPAREVAA